MNSKQIIMEVDVCLKKDAIEKIKSDIQTQLSNDEVVILPKYCKVVRTPLRPCVV